MSLEFFDKTDFEPEIVTLSVGADGQVAVPDAQMLFGAAFERIGTDLYLRADGAAVMRVEDFFRGDEIPDLVAANGSVLRGEVAARLAGPLAPAQYAQAGDAPADGPIGQVETLSGSAFAQRADGSVVELQVGGKIAQNDVIETGDDSAVSITFVDGTIFTLAANSRMLVDELIYDPGSSSNSGGFSLIQGSFVFIAGQVAKTGGMEVETPSATMGIRGTTVLVSIQTVDGDVVSEVTLTRDPDGGVGEVVLRDLAGNVIANITETSSKWVVSTSDGQAYEVPRSLLDDAEDGPLIAEAVSAYQSAVFRVENGQTFVTFGNQTGSGTGLPAGNNGSGQELDNVDDQPGIGDAPDGEDGEGDGNSGPFDDGRLRPEFLDAPDVEVTGLEDSGEGGITGTIVVPGGVGAVLIALNAGPANGQVTLAADGSFSYTPNANFNGTDTFTYQATDADGESGSGTVVVTVLPVNDQPVFEDSAASGVEDATISGTLAASDIDGDTLQYGLESGAQNGLVVLLESGEYVYTPDVDFAGSDSFTVRVEDGQGGTDIATVALMVAPVNDGPVITTAPDQAEGTVAENTGPVSASGLLEAQDVDAGAVLVWSGSADGTYGRFEVSEGGEWTYTLDPALSDALALGQLVSESFVATVTDDAGASSAQNVAITITGGNDAPVITTATGAAEGEVTEGAEIMVVVGQLSASDPDLGATLGWTGSAAGVYGALLIAADGAWSYTLDNAVAEELAEGQIVTESFTATVTDEYGATATQQIVVSVLGTNDAPVVVRDTVIETSPGSSVSGALVATDADSAGALVFAIDGAGPGNGDVTIDSDGGYVYTPDAGFQGIDRFSYSVTDSDGGSTTAQVTVEVVNESGAGDQGQLVSLSISPDAGGGGAAGSVAIATQVAAADSINLVFALDRSGSIGAQGWAEQTEAVAQAIEQLSAQFGGSLAQVDVKIISYDSAAEVSQVFDLQSPDLVDYVRDLPFTGGATDWSAALNETEAFFDTQPATESNFLFFVTDGNPTSGNWQQALSDLTDVSANGYAVQIEAFGIGDEVNFETIAQLDPSPVVLQGPADLTGAFGATPIFAPELVSFTLTLEVDGVDHGVIADVSSPALLADGLNYSLSFADIDGLADLLGDSNRFNAWAGFDLDGDATSPEVTLFSTEVFSVGDNALQAQGQAGNDLLLGSVLDDELDGGAGDDLLLGAEGADTLNGGAGSDIVLGGAGNDMLVLPDLSDVVNGGAGRDVLHVEQAGDLSADLVPILSGAQIEAIDLTNGAANTLELSISDLLGFSDSADTSLEALLGAALPDSATIYGDGTDALTLRNSVEGSFEQVEGPAVEDGQGNSLTLFEFSADGNVLATLAVDEDVAVTVAPVA